MDESKTIAILTALDQEYEAVREHLGRVQTHTHEKGTRWEVGTVPGGVCRIAIADAGKGNLNSAVLAERTFARFEPLALFFVGVAATVRDDIGLGDVVVANKVYAYQGGTSDDDRFRSRPQAWQAPHRLDQLAGEIVRSGSWQALLRDEHSRSRQLPDELTRTPNAYRAPIAAGELVLRSRTSVEAIRLDENYNDTAAVEMEGAGVAQAAQLNAYPSMLIRGISDYGNAEKERWDREGSQQVAARRAAAFAIELARRAASEYPEHASERFEGQDRASMPGRHAAIGASGGVAPTFTNLAQGNSHVGIQAGQILGDAYVGHPAPDRNLDLDRELKDLRLALEEAYRAGRIDAETHESAQAELTVATEACPSGNEQPERRFTLALKRLKGLLEDVADFGAKIATILAGVGRLR